MSRIALFALSLFTTSTLLVTLIPQAQAMCGCMLGRIPPAAAFDRRGLETKLISDSANAVLVREGNRTILSMNTDYRGEAEDFTIVIPVPAILEENQVRTIEPRIFDRLERLTAPRLMEYWEQNPCANANRPRNAPMAAGFAAEASADNRAGTGRGGAAEPLPPPPVVVEREYSIAEYDIVILSANDSSGLERWLTDNGYGLPEGASEVLRPYVESGMGFFLAKVDASRLNFVDGRALLSPLQFEFDSEAFSLPIRLGLLNSGGVQDLVVHTLTRHRRTEVANYTNATIPTNLRVNSSVRRDFGAFYTGLVDRTTGDSGRTVVTEFAKDLGPRDLSEDDLRALGVDRLPSRSFDNLTLSRLHYRYTKDNLGEDLLFRAADPIGGGSERLGATAASGNFGARPSGSNDFRARYTILHRFSGAIACDAPRRGVWGRQPGRRAPPTVTSNPYSEPFSEAQVLSALAGSITLPAVVEPEEIKPAGANELVESAAPGQIAQPALPLSPKPEDVVPQASNCHCRVAGDNSRSTGLLWGAALGFGALVYRRRRRRGG